MMRITNKFYIYMIIFILIMLYLPEISQYTGVEFKESYVLAILIFIGGIFSNKLVVRENDS